MRLIDADALAKFIDYGHLNNPNDKCYSENDIREMIDMMPTVDAVPVRHGKWIIRDNPGTGWYRITCSECGEDVTSEAPCIGFLPNAKVMWDYCPYCGARMDENENR